MVYLLAQIFGILGLIVIVISLFQKQKSKMLSFVMLNGIFFGIQYLLLGAYSGMISNFFGIARTYCFMKRENNKNYDKLQVLAFFLIGYIIIGFVTFDGSLIGIFPVIAEIIYVIAMWQKSTKRIRIGTLIMVSLWLVYDIIVMAYPSVITDLIVLSSTLIAIYVNDIKKTKEN